MTCHILGASLKSPCPPRYWVCGDPLCFRMGRTGAGEHWGGMQGLAFVGARDPEPLAHSKHSTNVHFVKVVILHAIGIS